MRLANSSSIAVALNVGCNNASTTFSGVLSGPGSLATVGSGALLLGGGNTYAGTTTINGGVLAAGAVNALPASSAVTVSGGTLDASSFANTVASLNVTGNGCLNLGLGNTLTSSGTAVLSGTLNVSGTGTLGNYRLLAYSSESGAFSSITAASARTTAWSTTATARSWTPCTRRRSARSRLTAANPTVITGGTTSLTVNVANSAPAGSDVLNFTASASGTGYGLSTTGSLAAASSGNFTIPNGFNSSSLAAGSYTGTITVTGTNSALTGAAINSGATQTVAVTVLGHATPALSLASGNNQTVIVGATGVTAGLTLSNGTLNQTGLASLDVNSVGSGVSGPASVACGSVQSYTVALNATALGTQPQTLSLNAGDNHTLPGASAPTNLSTTATLTVMDHSNASLSPAANQTTETINFGNVLRGADDSQPELHHLQPGGEHHGGQYGKSQTDRLLHQRRYGI